VVVGWCDLMGYCRWSLLKRLALIYFNYKILSSTLKSQEYTKKRKYQHIKYYKPINKKFHRIFNCTRFAKIKSWDQQNFVVISLLCFFFFLILGSYFLLKNLFIFKFIYGIHFFHMSMHLDHVDIFQSQSSRK